MKSRIQVSDMSDFPTDKQWERVILDTEELFEAVRVNSVRQLVREVLQTKYWSDPNFHKLIDDVTTTTMMALAETLKKTIQWPALCVLIVGDSPIWTAEGDKTTNPQSPTNAVYWRGSGVFEFIRGPKNE